MQLMMLPVQIVLLLIDKVKCILNLVLMVKLSDLSPSHSANSHEVMAF